MKRLLFALTLALPMASLSSAQIQPYDGFIYAYSDYNSSTVYGFPCAALFSDSHSGFAYCTVGPGPTPIQMTNYFGPTDESPNCNSNMRAEFDLVTASKLKIETTGSGGIEYFWILRNQDYGDVTSSSGAGESIFETELIPAGRYTLEVYYSYYFWNGGSLATSELNVSNLSTGASLDSYTVTQGTEFSGDLWYLSLSDDYPLCILPDDVTLVAQLQVNGTSPVASPVELAFVYEGHVERPGLSQTVALYNYAQSRYVTMAGGFAPSEDEVTEIIPTNPANYIGPNREVSSEITWSPINDEDPSQDGWLHCVDNTHWRITP